MTKANQGRPKLTKDDQISLELKNDEK